MISHQNTLSAAQPVVDRKRMLTALSRLPVAYSSEGMELPELCSGPSLCLTHAKHWTSRLPIDSAPLTSTLCLCFSASKKAKHEGANSTHALRAPGNWQAELCSHDSVERKEKKEKREETERREGG